MATLIKPSRKVYNNLMAMIGVLFHNVEVLAENASLDFGDPKSFIYFTYQNGAVIDNATITVNSVAVPAGQNGALVESGVAATYKIEVPGYAAVEGSVTPTAPNVQVVITLGAPVSE